MRIPFDIKYKPQIESGEYKVKTKSEQEVRIVCWDMNTSNGVLIVALVKGYGGEYEKMRSYTLEGKCKSASDEASLYIHTPEPELTEFEKAYSIMRYGSGLTAIFEKEALEEVKKEAATLLEYARRQFDANKEHQSSANITYQEIDNINVREKITLPNDMFKEFFPPIWKKIKDGRFYEDFTIDEYDNGRMVICKDNYEINIEDLWNKLTKED